MATGYCAAWLRRACQFHARASLVPVVQLGWQMGCFDLDRTRKAPAGRRCAQLHKNSSTLVQVEEVLRETIYYVPADTRMEDGKPVGSSSKCAPRKPPVSLQPCWISNLSDRVRWSAEPCLYDCIRWFL